MFKVSPARRSDVLRNGIVPPVNFSCDEESKMSKINGDKARFHRERKKRIAKRSRYRGLLTGSAATTASAKPASKSKPVQP